MAPTSKLNLTLRSYQKIARITQKNSFFSIWKSSPWLASKAFLNSVNGGSRGRDKMKRDISTVKRFFEKRNILSEEDLRSWFGAENVEQVGKVYSEYKYVKIRWLQKCMTTVFI